MNDPTLLSLATREAPHPVPQTEVKGRVRELFHAADFDVEELASVFDHAGVGRRTFALPLEVYADGLGPEARNRAFLEVAGELLEGAAREALPEALRERVTHVVSVCSSGVATPSLECAVMERLGIARSARRVPLFGLGCAGGVAGLAVARDLAASRPDGLVLLLGVELTSLTYLRSDVSRRNFVACALFGDGAFAALVGGAAHADGLGDLRPRARLGATRSRLFPDSADLMGWHVRDHGWEVAFSPRIPLVVRDHAVELVDGLVDRAGLRNHALHPGGAKILEAYRTALDLDGEALAPATDVLARHGNMSAVTVLFVLEEVLRRGRPGPGVATAFGPGFTADLMALEVLGDA